MSEAQQVWSKALTLLSDAVPEKEFACWIDVIRPVNLEHGRLTVEVPSRFHLERLRGRYDHSIVEALRSSTGSSMELVCSVNPPKGRLRALSATSIATERLAFADFLSGTSNRLAIEQATALVENALQPSALFLHGAVGVGKTHLSRAIAKALAALRPPLRVLVSSGERFLGEVVEAATSGRAGAFHTRYRSVDALILDDVQVVAGKRRTENELSDLLDALDRAGRRVVLVSQGLPTDIPRLDPRLRNRFEAAMIVGIEAPDVALRERLVVRKASKLGLVLGPDIVRWIARRAGRSVREIEGAILRLAVGRRLQTSPLDVATAEELLGPILPRRHPATPDRIRATVARRFGLEEETLRGRDRSRRLGAPRRIAMLLMRRLTGATYLDIARDFGGRSVSSVREAILGLAQEAETNPQMAELVDGLEAEVAG